MRTSVATAVVPTEGNSAATSFHDSAAVETAGKSLSRHCLIEAIDHSGVSRKVLASEVRQSESQFSKSLNGLPGGDFNHVLDRIRSVIRLDYAERLAKAEQTDGLEELAAEQLAIAAIRYLSTRRIHLKAAKAGLR